MPVKKKPNFNPYELFLPTSKTGTRKLRVRFKPPYGFKPKIRIKNTRKIINVVELERQATQQVPLHRARSARGRGAEENLNILRSEQTVGKKIKAAMGLGQRIDGLRNGRLLTELCAALIETARNGNQPPEIMRMLINSVEKNKDKVPKEKWRALFPSFQQAKRKLKS